MSSTEAPFSYTSKVDGNLFTVRGQDFSDFANNLTLAYGDAGQDILTRAAEQAVPLSAGGQVMQQAIAAVAPIAHPQQPAGYGAPAPAPAPLPASAPVAGGPPQCAHGDRKWVTSKPGAPKAWQAWMCGARQGDPTKCDPQWA